jgi:hypothetical protein
MSGASRTKGKAGERELAALLRTITGQDVQRRVRQHDGDSDLLGVDGHSVECKRYSSATPALVARWWQQTIAQAEPGTRPLLFYRVNRRPWRAVWAPFEGREYQDTVEGDPRVWWRSTGSQT